MREKRVETRSAEQMAVVGRMLAHAKREEGKPIVPRDPGAVTAFDHPFVKPRGPITVNSDRVVLCSPEKPCRMCRARAVVDREWRSRPEYGRGNG